MSYYCSKCGNICDDQQVFCPMCGTQRQTQSGQPYGGQPYGGQSNGAQPYGNQAFGNQFYDGVPQAPVTVAPSPTMKWFKFIIYFQLFANAVLNLLLSIPFFTGAIYGSETELTYRLIPDLKTADMIYASLMVIAAVFAIIVRFRLSGFHKDGPSLYYAVLAAQIGIVIFYMIASKAAIDKSILANYIKIDYSSVYSSMFTNIAMIICNVTYFSKRKHLFVN